MSIDGENLFDEVEDEMKNVAEDAAEDGAYRAGRRFLDYSKRKHANKKGKGKSTTGNGASTSAGKGAAGGSAGAAAEAGTGAGGATSGASSVAEGAAGDAAAKGASAAAGTSAGGATAGGTTGAAASSGTPVIGVVAAVAVGLLVLYLAICLLGEVILHLADDIPQVIIDSPYDTGFQIDESVPPDIDSATEIDAYYNTIRAIDEGIKIAQERAIKDFLKELDRKGYDREETLRNSDLTGLEIVSYEPLLINAVYAVMMRQEGCTIEDMRDILAENLEFKYSLSGPEKKEKTGLFEYRGVVHYKEFNAWEWREHYNSITGEMERYLELVHIGSDMKENVKYGKAVFYPLTREDFFAAFGYDDDAMGDTYYAEPVNLPITGWDFLDKIIDRIFQAGVYTETPHHESYFDAIISMTESTEKYLFNSVGGFSVDSYYSPNEYMQAFLTPEELSELQGHLGDLTSAVSNLSIVEVTDKEKYYSSKKKNMRALSSIPAQLTDESIATMAAKAQQCEAIANSWGGAYISNSDRITLRNNLKELRENALHAKMKDGQRQDILTSTRKAISILLQTVVIVEAGSIEEWDEQRNKTITSATRSDKKHYELPSCASDSGG